MSDDRMNEILKGLPLSNGPGMSDKELAERFRTELVKVVQELGDVMDEARPIHKHVRILREQCDYYREGIAQARKAIIGTSTDVATPENPDANLVRRAKDCLLILQDLSVKRGAGGN